MSIRERLGYGRTRTYTRKTYPRRGNPPLWFHILLGILMGLALALNIISSLLLIAKR